MICKTLQISCSQRCELLMALSYVLAPNSILPIAYKLAPNKDNSAVTIARALTKLPRSAATRLAKATIAGEDYLA